MEGIPRMAYNKELANKILDGRVSVFPKQSVIGRSYRNCSYGAVTTAPMTQLPLVLIPTYLVPTFLILHLTALFQARRSQQISKALPMKESHTDARTVLEEVHTTPLAMISKSAMGVINGRSGTI
jgi:hypothetical protein